ncbi:putative ABC efflux pump, inner membrane subunit [Candidatus Sulfopaludibacter sp. SbA4]|nr:putative ABC efflux pump, inner membrane subunit [Candidatus Sulfopaludibacter sp. SbA4]
MARWRSFFRGLLERGQVEREMSQEMEFHLQARAEDLIRRGMTLPEALRQARIEFGGVERYKEEGRESRGLRLVDEVRADLRYAWRQLAKAPSFTLLAVAILAIGIGANTAVFSTVNAVMLAVLPVHDPGRLRHLEWSAKKDDFRKSYNGGGWVNSAGEHIRWSVSYPVFQYLRTHTTVFSELSTFGNSSQMNVTIQGHAELRQGLMVSGDFFRMLGTAAYRGRILSVEDAQPGVSPVAVLSYGFWEHRLGAGAEALGQTILVNGAPASIVGVLPKGWCGIDPGACPDLFLPLANMDAMRNPESWYYEVMGRLKPGVAEERARAETEALIDRAIATYRAAGSYEAPRIGLEPAAKGLNGLRSQLTDPLTVMSWAVGAILLIACANIAGLLGARSAARQREIGTRLALGAGRGRLIRQLLVESLLLAALGTLAGIALAYATGDSIVRLFLGDRTLGISVAMNLRVLGVSAGLCFMTAILFGLLPALQATRLDTAAAMKGSGPAAERSRLVTAKGFIALQVAITLMLVLGSAVFLRTLINLYAEPLGFRPENLLTFQLNPTLNGYKDQRLLNFHEDVVRRLGAIPGVRSASMSRWGILSGSATRDSVNLPGQKPVPVMTHYVAPRFFETVGFSLLAGRDVEWSDREKSEPVLVINQALAQQLFGSESPLGRVVEVGGKCTIVGVAANTKFDSLRRAAPPTVYVPFRQEREHSMTYVLRSAMEPKALVPAVRRVVESVDPNVPPYEVRTQTERIGEDVRKDRVFALLFTAFGSMALILASLGIYGTLAYQVARRTPEIGVRVALGASRGAVAAMMMREEAAPVAVGLLVGIGGALEAGKFVESMMFGLKPTDPVTVVGAAGALLLSAVAAGWLPARRAASITPMQALRYD